MKTRKGETSIYVVIMTILIFGIITVGFSRLINREMTKTGVNDLAQSAYDSALAGVEDAKNAIEMYLSNPGGLNYIDMDPNKCNDLIIKAFQRDPNPTQQAVGNENSNQAYTCTKINFNPHDYLGTLDSENQVAVINITPKNGTDLKILHIEWYNSDNEAVNGGFDTIKKSASGDVFQFEANSAVFPLLSVQIIRADKSDYMDDANSDLKWLVPVPIEEWRDDKISVDWGKTKNSHSPDAAKCENGEDDYYCQADIEISSYDSNDLFLVLTAPYNNKIDYRITLLDSSNKSLELKEGQIVIDSTGRASDIFRRVETRIRYDVRSDLYPKYIVDIEDNEEDPESGNIIKLDS